MCRSWTKHSMSSIGTSNPLGGESVSFSQSLDRLKESFLWAAAQGMILLHSTYKTPTNIINLRWKSA